MKKYAALVTDKQTKQRLIIEREYATKAEFITDLRGNGYAVNPIKVKPAHILHYILDNTNCEPRDWKKTYNHISPEDWQPEQ